MFYANQVQDKHLLGIIESIRLSLGGIPDIVQQHGYPIWDEYYYTPLGFDEYLYAIPFAKDGLNIRSILYYVKKSRRFHYIIINRDNIHKDFKDIDWMFAYFDHRLYFGKEDAPDFITLQSYFSLSV